MYQNPRRNRASFRIEFQPFAFALLMTAVWACASAAAIDSGPSQLQFEPLQYQDAVQQRCQQRYADNLGQCVSGPLCYSDNGICNYPPAAPDCASQALAKYERCLARGSRLSTVN